MTQDPLAVPATNDATGIQDVNTWMKLKHMMESGKLTPEDYAAGIAALQGAAPAPPWLQEIKLADFSQFGLPSGVGATVGLPDTRAMDRSPPRNIITDTLNGVFGR